MGTCLHARALVCTKFSFLHNLMAVSLDYISQHPMQLAAWPMPFPALAHKTSADVHFLLVLPAQCSGF
jgi:hypothetical protein